jgi:hypothetical protein
MSSWWEQIVSVSVSGMASSPAITGRAPSGAIASAAAEDDIVFEPSQQQEEDTELMVWMGQDIGLGNTGSPDTIEARGSARTAPGSLMPASRAEASIYAWGRTEVQRFQDRLIESGLVQAEDIRYGVRDAATLSAWGQMVDAAAGSYLAGVRKSPWDIADEFAVAPPVPAEDKGPGRVQANPQDVRALAESTAKAVIGRGELTAEEQARFEASYRQWEAPYLGHSEAAPPGQAATQQFAEDAVREIDPLKADARKVAGKADLFARMLRGDA